MVSRLLAVLVAAGLVVAALAARGRIDAPRLAVGGDATGTVLCVTELADVCTALEAAAGGDLAVTVEDAGATLDALAGTEPPAADAWLTLAPWPQMARDRREAALLDPLVGEDRAGLGHSPLVLVSWEERAEALAGHCDPVTWDCVGEVAGEEWAGIGGDARWGPVKVGHAHPGRSAGGLLVLHQAVANRVGTAAYSRQHLRDDPAFSAWFTDFQRAPHRPRRA